jgi:hypothetical protein
MKYIINERQYKLITEEQEVLQIPSFGIFGDWETLQIYLKHKGNPLFSIEGDMDLSHSDIESLGNLVSVEGNLNLIGCYKLSSLGKLTSVGKNLTLNYSSIKGLDNLTSVGNDLFLLNCMELTSLDNLTSVGGYLDLGGCEKLTSLGNLKYVGDDLAIYDTPLRKHRVEIRQMVDIKGEIFF